MPIKKYDDPFKEYVREPPSEESVKLWEHLVKKGVIPKTGTTPLTLELIQKIFKARKELTWKSLPKELKSMEDFAEFLDIPFKIYTAYSHWMPKEVEVTPRFIDDAVAAWLVNLLVEGRDFVLGTGHPAAKKLEYSPTEKHLKEAIEKDADGQSEEALEALNKAVECRADIFPLMKRAHFFSHHEQINEAIKDYSLCIKEAIPSDDDLPEAYVNRGLCYIKKEIIESALDDMLEGFQLYHKMIKDNPEKYSEDPEKDNDILERGTVEFLIGKCVPIMQSWDKSPALGDKAKEKLNHLKDLILAIRQMMDY